MVTCWWAEDLLQQGQDSWSETSEEWTQLNKYWPVLGRKPFRGCKRLKTGQKNNTKHAARSTTEWFTSGAQGR